MMNTTVKVGTFTVEKIQYVREKTGCGVKSAKLALIKAKGDQEKALDYFVGGTLIRNESEPDYQELYRKEVLYKEVVLMKEIEGLRAKLEVWKDLATVAFTRGEWTPEHKEARKKFSGLRSANNEKS